MNRYVLGFLFGPKLDVVALIKKDKPLWQAGRYNGIGGKIEPGESELSAMIREFKEETGVEFSEWYRFGTLSGKDFSVGLFAGRDPAVYDVSSVTNESVVLVDPTWKKIRKSKHTLENLKYLIPYAMGFLDDIDPPRNVIFYH